MGIFCIMYTKWYYDIQNTRRYQKLALRYDYTASTLLNTKRIIGNDACNIIRYT